MEKKKRGRPKKKIDIPVEVAVSDAPQIIPQTPLVTISLKANDEVLSSEGETIFDALCKLPKPKKIMGKGFLTVIEGKKRKDKLLMPVRLRRLFYNKYFLGIIAKNLAIGMK